MSSPPSAPAAPPLTPRGLRWSLFGRSVEVAKWVQVKVLVYLTAATATAYGLWKLLGQKDDTFSASSWQFWVALAVAVIPALATLVGYTIPDWQARRRRRLRDWSVSGDGGKPKHFRLTPYDEGSKDAFRRDDQAHMEALNWVRVSKERVLYLTGVSGSGKSSILAAYVAPELRAEALVVQLRASDDPVENLRASLLIPGVVWKEAQARRHEGDDTLTLVCAAAEHLGRSGKGLLVAVDQFEEALVQNATPLLDLLKSVAAGSCPSCRVILTLRIEFLGDLSRAGLPPDGEANRFVVPPFTQSAARAFLEGGFDRVGSDLLDRVVAEAVVLDNLSGRVRPVTLNMVGQMLRRMPAGAGSVAVGNRPFADYVRRVLEENDIRDHAPVVLRQLLDGVNRRLHKSVRELAGPGGDVHAVDGCLGRLAIPERGLVWCLNPREREVGARRWEVSHDFVAAVLGAVLLGLRPGVWATTRRWLAPAALVLWLGGVVLFLPYEQARQTALRAAERDAVVRRLNTEFGIRVMRTETDGSLAVRLDPLQKLESFSEAGPLLSRLGPISTLEASGNETLRTVDGLGELIALRVVDLSDCKGLTTVEPLRGLTALQALDLSWCRGLTTVEPLRGLTALQTLDLSHCRGLTIFEPLWGLTRLQALSLLGCDGLTTVEPMQDVKGLKITLPWHLSSHQ